MLRFIIPCALFALPLLAQAENLHLSDLKSQNAVQLTADELKQLMPGAKVAHHSDAGSLRRWTNEADGKFVASSDVHRDPGWVGKTKSSGGRGTWHIGDNATYCVAIEWPGRSENWCRYIFKAGDKYYGVKSLVDGAGIASEIQISR
ncbi:MAG: hypothetical protein IPH26_16100 [Sterolibacteriaceae bacterium]|uniref:DUF995 domain-containing protein n=1 Tax=Candidatus Methylophosphatis roskildensis TaxID=2899263 RepID=A0A9D7HV74_9PROT|nr:hypothetical protein [Candidatus Methylophosphatis roskildensis]